MKHIRYTNLVFIILTVVASLVYQSYQFDRNHTISGNENILEIIFTLINGLVRLIAFHHVDLFITALPLYYFMVRYKSMVLWNISVLLAQVLSLILSVQANFDSMLSLMAREDSCLTMETRSFLLYPHKDFPNFIYYTYKFPLWWHGAGSGMHNRYFCPNAPLGFFFPECNLKLLILITLFLAFIAYTIISKFFSRSHK